ncbi:MAG: ABC transporter ATP-binding protein [Parcubacteria group bacterium]
MQRTPYLHLLKTSWKFAKGRRGKFVLTYCMFVVANGVILLEPAVIGQVFNEIQRGGGTDMRRIALWLALFGVIPFVFWCFHGVARVLERDTAFVIERNAREFYFKTITELPLRWHKDHHSGETHDRVEKATYNLQRFASHGFRDIEIGARVLFCSIAITYYLPLAGLVVLGVTSIVVLVILRYDRVLGRLERSINERRHSMAAVFYDYVANIKTIITLRLEKLACSAYAESVAIIFPVLRREIRLNEVKWFTVSMLLMLMHVAIMAFYIWNGLAAGAVMLGGLVALYGYVSQLGDAFFRFAGEAQELLMYSVSVRAVDPMLASHGELSAQVLPLSKPVDWQRIELRGLWFKYEDKEHREHQLRDIGLEIKRGARIALVGESGSGKSTLLYLLRGLDRPERFKLCVDGNMQKDFRTLAASTTLVPQDPEIFENTIRFNITAGVTHGQAAVSRAVTISRFTPVLKRLPRGLETHIKERGVNLSGGEKQRLALARGVYAAQESSLLLLDEPTSSVDSLNELAIYKRIFEYFKGQTVISTIHRLHLLQHFDYIYVLANGRIIEEGTYDGLWRKPAGVLAAMIRQYGTTSSVR